MRTPIAVVWFVLFVAVIPGAKASIYEVQIVKAGTNVVTIIEGNVCTGAVRQSWFENQVRHSAAATLNITATLGELTFGEVVDAIDNVSKQWRGSVCINISAVEQGNSIITLSTRHCSGGAIRVLRGALPLGRRMSMSQEQNVVPVFDEPVQSNHDWSATQGNMVRGLGASRRDDRCMSRQTTNEMTR